MHEKGRVNVYRNQSVKFIGCSDKKMLKSQPHPDKMFQRRITTELPSIAIHHCLYKNVHPVLLYRVKGFQPVLKYRNAATNPRINPTIMSSGIMSIIVPMTDPEPDSRSHTAYRVTGSSTFTVISSPAL